MKCSETAEACQVKSDEKHEESEHESKEEEEKEEEVGLECLCACPKIMTIGEDMAKLCADKAGTVGCIKSTEACAPMEKGMNEKQIDLGCKYANKGCEDNNKKMPQCFGQDNLKSWGL